MRRAVLVITLCCALFALIIRSSRASHLAQTRKPATLCSQNETIIFSCGMRKSTKILSLCGSKDLSSQKGYVQYRFGQPGKVELEYPTSRQNTQSAFNYARYTRPLVTYLALRFETNGYKYSIHQDDVEDIKPVVRESYINVTAPGKDAVEMKCSEPVIGGLMKLEDIVPNDEGDVPPTEP
ncbi:MAG: hypothetical protein JO360_06715 [Acidobacteria bacterium]|nr:hypothetical protein [Acidobacteriota bacterium]